MMAVKSTGKAVLLLADEENELGANRLRAMERYAMAMGWTFRICSAPEVAPALAECPVDLVLCWRLSDLAQADALYAACRHHGVDILPLAQSCSALSE